MKRKNISKIFFVSLFVLLLCTACDGTVTRNIRHAGFSIGNSKFTCDNFYPSDKKDTSYEKIKYFLGTHIINSDGKIYEVSTSQTYTNGQNCREADTMVRVKAIMDNKIIKGMDDRYYYLVGQNNAPNYTEIPETDQSYRIYDLLLQDEDVVKVTTVDSNGGLYYVLKIDGNIYGTIVSKEDRNSPPVITETQIVFNKVDFEGRILDYNYAGNSVSTFVKTEEKVFRMMIKNNTDCKKFADIACEYELREDPIFEEYKDRIIAYNGTLLLTDYKKTFTVNS